MIRRKKKTAPMVPVAAMADIAFLLIIFFMLTSNFIKEKDIKYTPAKSVDIDKLEPIAVSVIIDEKGEVYVQGKPCPVMSIEYRINKLMEEKDPKDRVVLLKVDKDITKDVFHPVLLAIGDTGVTMYAVGEKAGE